MTDDDSKELEALKLAERHARERLEAAKREAGIVEVQKTPPRTAWTIPWKPLPAEDIAAREEKARAHRAAQRARDLVERLPPAFRWATLTDPEACPVLVKRVTNRIAIGKAREILPGERVIFRGPSGSGKTSLAVASARMLATEGKAWPFFVSAYQIANARARHPLGEGEPRILVDALAADLLVLDELGSEERTVGGEGAIKELIFERHWRDSPTWITTWMTLDQMGEKYGEGTARRIFEGATVIDCGAP